MGFKTFYTMKISLNTKSSQISIYHKKKVFFCIFPFYQESVFYRLVFLVFDTSGPHSLCGDCGGLPVLVVGSTLQADKGRKRRDKNQS